PRRQGNALRTGARRRDLPPHQGAVLDVPAGLAARGARAPHRGHRGLLPDRHPRLGARPLARALRPPCRGRVTPILEMRGVRKSFGGVVANRDVTLSVPEGKTYGLIGPNGSGKTRSEERRVGKEGRSAGPSATLYET